MMFGFNFLYRQMSPDRAYWQKMIGNQKISPANCGAFLFELNLGPYICPSFKYCFMVDVILGLQWGDEGKGKIVDYFASQYDIIARFQGGPNAGHTLYVGDQKIVLHQIPSGVFHEQNVNLIGIGVVLDPVTLRKEADKVAAFGIDLKKNL